MAGVCLDGMVLFSILSLNQNKIYHSPLSLNVNVKAKSIIFRLNWTDWRTDNAMTLVARHLRQEKTKQTRRLYGWSLVQIQAHLANNQANQKGS